VCRGPYNETVADNWFAMHDSRYSFDYGAFEKKDAYSGGCRYVEDPRTGRVHCFIIEAEDSARADWPVTDTRGNLGYFRQCVAEPVGSPAVTLVLVLALLVGLAAARRR
jgi:MYXO-CTERM domain-containing protein